MAAGAEKPKVVYLSPQGRLLDHALVMELVLLGLADIDPDGNIPHPQGTEVPLLPKASDGVEVGGRLKEIV